MHAEFGSSEFFEYTAQFGLKEDYHGEKSYIENLFEDVFDDFQFQKTAYKVSCDEEKYSLYKLTCSCFSYKFQQKIDYVGKS